MKIFSYRMSLCDFSSLDTNEITDEIKNYCKANERSFDDIKWLQSQSEVYFILTAIVG